MALTTSTAFLKTTYLPGYVNQLENEKQTLFGLLFKSSEVARIEGGTANVKLRIGDSLGQGSIPEGGDFPTPGDIESAQATLACSHLAHTVKWTEEEMVYLDGSVGAAAPVIKVKMDAAMAAMSRDIERQSWMDGTGLLANVASAAGVTLTLDATTTVQADRDRYIWVDDANRMRYDVVHGTTGAQQVTGFTITDIAYPATEVLTCSATMTSATAAGVLVRSGNWASAGAYRSLEFQGIQAMIGDSNTYLGINRATAGNGFWKSAIDSNSGTLRALSETMVHTIMNKIRRRRDDGRAPGKSDYVAFASPGSWTSYHNLLSPGLRFTLGEVPDIGWPAPLNFKGIPLYDDIHCPRNGYIIMHTPSIKYVKPKYEGNISGELLKFKDLNGTMFFQGNAAVGQGHSANVYSYLDGFIGMYTDRPRNHGWLKDITETASAY